MFVETAPHPDPGTPPATSPRADLARLTTEHLDREITTLAAEIYAATCRWLELIAEFDRRKGYKEHGFWSCSSWLSWRCGVGRRAARDRVRVARALTELPRIRAAFGRGELSYSKVRALTRVAVPEDEELLLDYARHATASQLDRLVRGYSGALDPEAALQAKRDRYLSWSWDEDGSLIVNGRLPAEEGALFLRAIEAAGDELRRDQREDEPADDDAAQGGSAEPPSANLRLHPEERRRLSSADAIVAMSESAIASGIASLPGSERYQVLVHVDADTLVGGGDGRASLDDGPGLCPETARRLACDATVTPISRTPDGSMRTGRRTRTVPPSMRRALRARDGGCRFPGCHNRRFVDAHHIEPWAQGGDTTLENLVELCRRHHDLLHEGGFSVERRGPDRFVFRRPDGATIAEAPRLPRAVPRDLAVRNRRAGIAVGPESCYSLSAGERFDLDLAVLALGSCRERANRARAPG